MRYRLTDLLYREIAVHILKPCGFDEYAQERVQDLDLILAWAMFVPVLIGWSFQRHRANVVVSVRADPLRPRALALTLARDFSRQAIQRDVA